MKNVGTWKIILLILFCFIDSRKYLEQSKMFPKVKFYQLSNADIWSKLISKYYFKNNVP